MLNNTVVQNSPGDPARRNSATAGAVESPKRARIIDFTFSGHGLLPRYPSHPQDRPASIRSLLRDHVVLSGARLYDDNVPPKGPRPVIPGQIMPMMIEKPLRFPGKLRTLAGLAAVVCVASCGPATLPTGYDDPREAQNREIHDFNRSIDRALLRPASTGYDSLVPEPLKTGVSNVARNLDAPGDIVNGILQGRPADAGENTLRFAVNTVFGIGGLFDVSTALGMDGRSTDFGETLHVWGVGEGNYLEFPFLGPTTERDLIGTGVDIALNPMRYVLPNREGNAATGLKIASGLRDRARYSDTIDSVLYESADSYAQTRLLYLQSRRFELSNAEGEGGDDAFLDPYEDPYGE